MKHNLLSIAKFLVLFCITGFLCSAQAAGQRASVYEIEMIVFKRNVHASAGSEFWPPVRQPSAPTNVVRLTPIGVKASANSAQDTAQTPGSVGLWQSLPASEQRLRREHQRLQATRAGLQPLFHAAWRQPVQSKSHSRPVYVSGQSSTASPPRRGAPPPELEGTVMVSRNRYLHIDLDLRLYDMTHGQPIPAVTIGQSYPEDSEETSSTTFEPTFAGYRLQDHRRMRSGELHYVDHPMLGVLILATPYRTPPRQDPPPTGPDQPAPSEPGQNSPGS